ncbi:probable serine/threonine-protein kinase ndrD [Microplitis mediator]|uniref:probable serine/threonine-protein kinase ndrD n=1 Tax=Microplitis mediator TaxID=375433 RepID=UPI002557538E|nr:probable serine/threonine-protein kinase ndrD [Microplitis mediator]XP_057324186.1 probable serine/threonine-protein kinase ndrD [Microplitis mediator]XP_057324187.1 probable serine/threonine-protein kinase ndrD [Microplitis mediator]
MLTVMCPNCRHRFPAPGCCNPESSSQDTRMHPSTASSPSPSSSTSCGNYYSCGNGSLLPRGYTNGGCIINAPTIIHGPTIIQSNQASGTAHITPTGFLNDYWNIQQKQLNSECKINTTCDLTGGTVTITTPNIQSGGYLIQSSPDVDALIHSPRIEIRPKLSGGGCLLQKRLSEDNNYQLLFQNNDYIQDNIGNFNYQYNFDKDDFCPSVHPPSGCQELPGIRRNSSVQSKPDNFIHNNINPASENIHYFDNKKHSSCRCPSQSNSINNSNYNNSNYNNNNYNNNYNSNNNNNNNINNNNNSNNNLQAETCQRKLSTEDPGAVQIKVSATIQLPANVDQCTLNITATKSFGNNVDTITTANGINSTSRAGTSRNIVNNLSGGGLVQTDSQSVVNLNINDDSDKQDDLSATTPTTPVSWLMPLSYTYEDIYALQNGQPLTGEIKKLLGNSGWYYGNMNWQQSENLLKNMEIGRWLVRDSSDSRYAFTISVQTKRGPTSVRVHYYNKKFRLDSEPALILMMPQFDCPIKLLDFYIYFSKYGNEKLTQVWVDYSGHVFSKIFLTNPVVKDVSSLSHLARIVINKNKIDTKHLPNPIKNYIAEYPYTF